MAELAAWIMDFGNGHRAATGIRTLVHLVPAPVLADVPRAPVHCRRVLVWNRQLLPAWDVGAFLGSPALASDRAIAGIAAYHVGAEARLGALLLREPPLRASVVEPQDCELPDPRWAAIAAACFMHDGQALPVLDLRRIFASPIEGSLPSAPDEFDVIGDNALAAA